MLRHRVTGCGFYCPRPSIVCLRIFRRVRTSLWQLERKSAYSFGSSFQPYLMEEIGTSVDEALIVDSL